MMIQPNSMQKIYVANDHAGFKLKQHIHDYLSPRGYDLVDLGCFDGEKSVDYPDYADKLADALFKDKQAFGILICGSGIGISIAANRHRHIRAALCHTPLDAALARKHNNANVIALGERVMGGDLAIACVDGFLTHEFEGGRHQARIDKFS